MNAVVMFLIQSSVIGALACLGSVTAVVRNSAPLPCSGDSRTIAPLPCCGCAFMYRCHDRMTCTCSATRLLGRHPSRCSAPLFHNHVGVICTLAVRTACLASRVACVRAWSWLSHPRPPDRSQHGCTVGVDREPTRVMLHPGRVVEHQSASSCRAGLCVVVRRVHGLWIMPSIHFVLCSLTPLLDMVTTCGPVDLERHFAPLVAQRTR